MKRVLLVRTLLVIAVVFITTLIVRNLIPVYEARHQVSSVQPQAAAVRLLQALGSTVKPVYHSGQLFPLPDHSFWIMMDRHHEVLTQDQLGELLQWVDSGGRLVVEADAIDHNEYRDGTIHETTIDQRNPLLRMLGVSAWYFDEGVRRQELPEPTVIGTHMLESDWRQYCLNPLAPQSRTCALRTCGDGDIFPLFSLLYSASDVMQFELDPRHHLAYEASAAKLDHTLQWSAGHSQGQQLLWFNVGHGDIIALSDFDIFQNSRLHHLDHAALIALFAEGRSGLLWSHHMGAPSLLYWLWQRSSLLISSLIILLLLLLWRHIPRRGVIVEQKHSHAVNFTDHLHASGELLWRTGQQQGLLLALRQDVQRRIAASETDQEATPENAERMEWAMQGVPKTREELRSIVALLQSLR
ncbi:MAG: hypothetical protein CVV10_03905 [Gammaproteobacteria bacterium HGW-Gammaproteobacteria-14]|nr:MAG: hypothetical protein CVV10_03905 [Gammaproteobacteria bacterium HGW-Gammaproteobacteria-14]